MKTNVALATIQNTEELEKIKDKLSLSQYLQVKTRIEELDQQIQNMIFEGGPANYAHENK